jgi:hypothetical protein
MNGIPVDRCVVAHDDVVDDRDRFGERAAQQRDHLSNHAGDADHLFAVLAATAECEQASRELGATTRLGDDLRQVGHLARRRRLAE